MIPHRFRLALAASALAVALSGCVSLLPKSEPAQLYTFGHSVDAAPSPPPAAAPVGDSVGVLLGAVIFPRAATGDGILTMTGPQAAYLAASRWVAPASLLFREAVERRFDRSARRVRLINRGETGRTPLILRIEVRDFAALYLNGPQSTPTVAVSVNARLTRADGAPVAERDFDVRRPASDNRVGPIVGAFDKAVDESLGAVVDWTEQTAVASGPAAGQPPR